MQLSPEDKNWKKEKKKNLYIFAFSVWFIPLPHAHTQSLESDETWRQGCWDFFSRFSCLRGASTINTALLLFSTTQHIYLFAISFAFNDCCKGSDNSRRVKFTCRVNSPVQHGQTDHNNSTGMAVDQQQQSHLQTQRELSGTCKSESLLTFGLTWGMSSNQRQIYYYKVKSLLQMHQTPHGNTTRAAWTRTVIYNMGGNLWDRRSTLHMERWKWKTAIWNSIGA